MKAIIDVPQCKHLHACNRLRAIAKKCGAEYLVKCNPLNCTAYEGNDNVATNVKKEFYGKVMEENPIIYMYIRESTLERTSYGDGIHYTIVIPDHDKYSALVESERYMHTLREVAKSCGISYLAISTPRPYRTIYDSDFEEAK